ncbi:ABC transporter permease [Rhodococcus pseudokoreensis]|uniref:ABC transporter permease n=1 Tax=Rhodococcus pseudokoreensis TaxID=2811421 RepID=A0A974W1Z0_9NOCA|nr:ABC transporter permease [Rhodococcus pseudokoreensis]QSE89805.1 ABC transporter permease [Rhodococcus pseudokoreensis]
MTTSSIPTRRTAPTESPFGPRRRVGRETLKALLRQPAGAIGAVLTVFFVVIALFAPWLAPHPPLLVDPFQALAGPSGAHWLGTDDLGRDVLSRLLYGVRPALIVGTVAVLVGGSIGIILGVLAGYYRGTFEAAVMRLCDIVFAFPLVLVGVCTVVILGPGVLSVGLAVGIGTMPLFARLARAETFEETSRDYIQASRGMGANTSWIVGRQILPNIAASMVVQMATAISVSVVIASSLDFLGLGTQPPAPSWGNMLQESRSYLAVAPVFAIAPGLILTVFVLAVNMLAAGLTNALDPRIRTKLVGQRRPSARRRGATAVPVPAMAAATDSLTKGDDVV